MKYSLFVYGVVGLLMLTSGSTGWYLSDGGACDNSDVVCSSNNRLNIVCCEPGETCIATDIIASCTDVVPQPENTTSDSGTASQTSTTGFGTTGATGDILSGTTTGSTSSNIFRTVVTENRGNLFKVVSSALTQSPSGSLIQLDNLDVIFFQWNDTFGLFEVNFAYYTMTNGNESVLDYKIHFYQIIEFLENGTTPGFQPEEDTVLQRYELDEEGWSPFRGPFIQNGLITFTGVTSDKTLAVRGFVSENLVVIPKTNRDLKPNEVKFDIDIDFRERYSSPNSQLALYARIKTFTRVRQGQDMFVTFFGNEEAHADFSWVPTASTPDVGEVTVLPSPLTRFDNPAEPEYDIYFTFLTNAHTAFFWDPSVSTQNDYDTKGNDKQKSLADHVGLTWVTFLGAALLNMLAVCF